MKIYITGVSGVGKTSLAQALSAHGINAIDIDEISHWENKTTKETVGWEPGLSDEWLNAHDWVCDLNKLKEIINKEENSVALGHAANQDEYIGLFDKKFVLECSPETIERRLKERTNNDFGKHPDDLARILEWNKSFTSWMVAKGASVLDGEKPLDILVSEVASQFKQ